MKTYNVGAIHGVPYLAAYGASKAALAAFKHGRIKVLVATDIAARGIDVEALPHVINFDIPNEPETYVHRVGRTGRAGESGTAVSFCTADDHEDLRAIERLLRRTLPAQLEARHPVDLLHPVRLLRHESAPSEPGILRG